MTDILFHILLPIGLCGSLFYALLRAARPLLAGLGPRIARGLLLVGAALFVLPLPLLGPALTSLLAPSASAAGGEAILLSAPLARPAVQAGRALGAALQVSSAAEAGGGAGRQSLLPLLGWVYLAGALAALALTLYRWLRLTRRLHAASRPVTDPAVLAQYARICAELRVARPPRLYQSGAASAPLLAGWRRARILLPHACLQPTALEYAFRHELAHHQSADLPCKYLLALLCALHWYNPLAHLLPHDFSAACEESCDARVTESMPPARRKAYAQTLLQFAAPAPAGPISAFGGPARRLRGRLERLLRPAKPGRALRAAGLAALALMLCLALLAGCGLAAGASGPPAGASSPAPSSAPGADASSSFPPANLAALLPDLLGKTLAEAEAELKRLGIPYRVTTIENTRGEAYENTIARVRFPVSALAAGSGATRAEKTELVVYRSSGAASDTVLPVSEAGFVCPVPDVEHYARGFDGTHRGLDFNAPAGTPVYAAAAGQVLYAGFHDSHGYYIVLAHEGGLRTLYSHCEQLLTATGDAVTQGQQIATVGNTGNSTGTHLHLEMTEGAGETLEEAGTLLDPADYLILPDVPFGKPA